MEVTYINANGERLSLRQTRPFFLSRAEGLGRTRQTISTFKAPEQDRQPEGTWRRLPQSTARTQGHTTF